MSSNHASVDIAVGSVTSTGRSITYTGSGNHSAVQGWECPRCHRILSPMTSECPCWLSIGVTNTVPPYSTIADIAPLNDALKVCTTCSNTQATLTS